MRGIKLHKAGYSLLIKIFIVLVLINCTVFYFSSSTLTQDIFLIFSIVFYFLCVNFFRSPNRIVVMDDNHILAPADGKIVVIEETEENEFIEGKCLQVSIFMNIFNVHINWFPVNGIVRYFKYHKGKFSAAYLPKSSTENERTSIGIECKNGRIILMRQIAGAMAKRIVSYTQPGTPSRQDEHAGFIKFGSRVDLFLPLDTNIDVKLNQKTKGSQTVIGTFANNN